MTNVFLIRDSILHTPRVDRCGVAGVMRGVVPELAAAAGLAAEERVLDGDDLQRAEEVFLTNALIGIRPVRVLEGVSLTVGPRTRALQEQLAARLTAAAGPGCGSR